MFTRTIGRVGAGAVLAVGLLLAAAMPAAANPTHDVVIESSSTIGIGGTSTHFGGHATTNTCAPNSSPAAPIQIATDSNGNSTVLNTPYTTGYGDLVVGTLTFKAKLTITSGTIFVGPSSTDVVVTLTVVAEIRTCNSQTVLCTTNPATIVLTGHNTTSRQHPQVSDRYVVSGATHVTAPVSCNFLIRPAINSQIATVTLNLHVTT